MKRLYDHHDDFEAEMVILPEQEGGRKSAPFNGIRWDFLYEGDKPTESLYMIWPEFVDGKDDAIPRDVPLKGTLRARMYIVDRKLADALHRDRIKVGTKFFAMEGACKVAKGMVTKITGLAGDSNAS